MKHTLALLSLLSGVALSACSNVVDRSSDPMRGYSGLKEGVPVGKPNSNVEKFCGEPFKLSVMALDRDGAEQPTNLNLTFAVGQPATYRFYSSSRNVTLKTTQLPAGATFNPNGEGLYELHWKPTDRQAGKSKFQVLATSNLSPKCTNIILSPDGSLAVVKSNLQPLLTAQLPTDRLYSEKEGENAILFTVILYDPSLEPTDKPADLKFKTVPATRRNPPYLSANGQNVIRCGDWSPAVGPGKFSKQCRIDIRWIIAENPDIKGLQSTALQMDYPKAETVILKDIKFQMPAPTGEEHGK